MPRMIYSWQKKEKNLDVETTYLDGQRPIAGSYWIENFGKKKVT